jgi:hypothetical protein
LKCYDRWAGGGAGGDKLVIHPHWIFKIKSELKKKGNVLNINNRNLKLFK